jgi:hypothetical protein
MLMIKRMRTRRRRDPNQAIAIIRGNPGELYFVHDLRHRGDAPPIDAPNTSTRRLQNGKHNQGLQQKVSRLCRHLLLSKSDFVHGDLENMPLASTVAA